MSRWVIALFLTLTVVVNPWIAVRYQPGAVTLHVAWVDTTDFPTVRVHFSAWDEAGLPLTGLAAGQFSLLEDGYQSQPEHLQVDVDAPVRVALVIDISGSMAGQPLQDAKVAAARFLDHLQPGDQIALIAFSDPVDPDPTSFHPERELAFTSELWLAYDLVESLQAGGQTQLYNAATKAVRLFADVPPGHRAVLLLSDGRNEPPEIGDAEGPIRLAGEANVPFFVIGLGGQIDLPYLQHLGNDTGGLFRAVPRSSELAQLFAGMAALLKTQYVLEYQSSLPADGGQHTLSLILEGSGLNAESSLQIGPLPLIPTATTTALPSATPTSTPIPATATQAPAPKPTLPALTPAKTPLPSLVQQVTNSPLSWLLAGLVLVSGGWLLFSRRRSRPVPEACAQCGYDLTGRSGACPQCGGTRRLPKR